MNLQSAILFFILLKGVEALLLARSIRRCGHRVCTTSSLTRVMDRIDPWDALMDKVEKRELANKSNRRSNNPLTGKQGKTSSSSSSSGDRDIPDELQCEHFNTCSGCTRRGQFNDTLTMRRARLFFSSADIDMQVHMGPVTGWRTHAKLAVRPTSRWGGVTMGLFKANTHDVESIPHCRVHHPRVNEAIEFLQQAANKARVVGYQRAESVGRRKAEGELRYVQVSLERRTGKVQCVVVWHSADYKSAGSSLTRLTQQMKTRPDLIHSLSVNFNPTEENNIFTYAPGSWKLLWGPPMMKETIGKATFYFRPQIFRQANLDAFEAGIVPLVAQSVPTGARVAELYSGLGILGLNAAETANAEEVLCSDSNDYVKDVFARSAASLSGENKNRVTFESLSAAEAIEEGQLESAQCLIVDPPRKGLDEEVLKVLLNRNTGSVSVSGSVSGSPDSYNDENDGNPAVYLTRLIYVSCSFESMERDARKLIDSRLWKIKAADAFVLFPGSDHIETVAVFDRV